MALHDDIIAVLRTLHDPEIPVNLHDLGLIRRVDVDSGGAVAVMMTLTTPNCPVADLLPEQVRSAIAGVEGVTSVSVEMTWEPAWTPRDLTDRGRAEMDLMGLDIDHMIAKLGSSFTDLTSPRMSPKDTSPRRPGPAGGPSR